MPSPSRLVRWFASAALVALVACADAPPPPVAAPPSTSAPRALAIDPPPAAPEDKAAVPVAADDPTWGSRAAPVTVVLFSEFQCPYCAKLVPTLVQLRAAYGPEKMRFVWKHNPLAFHPNAAPAAEAAAGVFALGGSELFWQFHDRAFANQTALSPASYEMWASQIGLDPMAIRAGMDDHRWKAKVDGDLELGKRLGVTGTPAAFVNGKLVSGAQSYDKWKEVIDAELAAAVNLAQSGMPADRVYLARAQANYSKPPPVAPEPKADTTTVHKVPVGASPVRGKATALVTIVEFADYQCPYCKRSEATLDQVMNEYVDDVRIVWKDNPLSFHARAEPAMQLAREARAQKGDAAFWKVHDALFDAQAKLEDADLDTIAAAAGLDMPRARRAIGQHLHRDKAAADMDLADDLQASGTPHFFINGRRLVGAQPYEKFKAIIDEEIAHAKKLLAEGTPPAALYDRMIKDGQGPRPLDTLALSLPARAPSRGNPGASIVIQEVADFQCPFCGRAQATIEEVTKQYGARVRIVWRDKPLAMHPDALLAAQAAREALAQQGNAGFWKMHDLLFANQSRTDHPDGLKRPALDAYAAQIGLDMGRWAAAIDGETHRAEVEADARATQDAGITGTPGFVIGGYFINGAQPASKFRRVIEEVIAHGPARPQAPTAARH